MTAYRSESECLRAELRVRDAQLLRAREANEHMRTELETATKPKAEPSKHWTVEDWSGDEEWAAKSAAGAFLVVLLYVAACLLAFIIGAHIPFSWPSERRCLVVAGILVVVWCLAFVRRRPR